MGVYITNQAIVQGQKISIWLFFFPQFVIMLSIKKNQMSPNCLYIGI